mmetsp:Transcript_19293/g.56306  ORF Transcript_19293/g.56306 Transcript_19293/m.56306 type:complete len:146 (+) Transcript_19293:358-795(+)
MISLVGRRAAAVGVTASRNLTRFKTQTLPLVYPQHLFDSRHGVKAIRIPFRLSSAEATDPGAEAETVPIIYVDPLGKEHEVQAEIGKNLLDVAHDNDIELEGACGGELACATCHLVFEKEVYDTLPEKLDEEDDMLDLAFELTDT